MELFERTKARFRKTTLLPKEIRDEAELKKLEKQAIFEERRKRLRDRIAKVKGRIHKAKGYDEFGSKAVKTFDFLANLGRNIDRSSYSSGSSGRRRKNKSSKRRRNQRENRSYGIFDLGY